MLRIRLQRAGRKHDPKFRVVLTDQKNGPKSGRFLDVLGSYDAKMGNIQLNAEKIKEWIAKGAQVSDTVHNMLVSQKIIEAKKVNVLPKKTPVVKELTEEEKAAEAAKEASAEEPAESAAEAPKDEAPTESTPADNAEREAKAEVEGGEGEEKADSDDKKDA